MPVITYEAVQTEVGRPLTDAEQGQVAQWITDAEMMIGVRLGDITELDQDVVKYVVRMAATARLRNPSGVSEESRQIDDFKVTRKLSSSVHITDDWWELLSPTATSSAFTIRPVTVYAERALDAERLDPWYPAP